MNRFLPIVNHSLKYNPSIDGLRGIAISLVLLFHIWPEYFSFGYVGVDIFFVLSGYLITQIIYTKLESNNFSLKEFYRNRIRRIFPTLIVVFLFSLLVGYLFMLPTELEQLGKHVKSSAFFYENFRLMDEVGYWDEAAVLKPLLHFWSLAIEEQFYIFWPLVLILLYRLKINILYTLGFLFLLLFITPLLTEVDKFYHTLARAWELAFGGFVFVLAYKNKTIYELFSKYKLFVYLFFIFSIGLSFDNTDFSTSKTLLVILGSGLVILSLSSHTSQTIFSNKVLVFLGLISFPLYLWHYVLISYAHIFGLDFEILGFILVGTSILLSYFTYVYIEIYARAKSSYKFVVILFTVVLAIGFLGNYIAKKDGLPNRTHLESNEKYKKQFMRTSAQNKYGVNVAQKTLGYKPTNNYIKATSDDTSKNFILIIGDSHAHTSYPGFAQEFSGGGYETMLLANSGCQPLINGARAKNLNKLKQCKKKINSIYEFIKKFDENIEMIIYIARGPKVMYNIGFGVVDGGLKPSNAFFEEYYIDNVNYNHKDTYFKKLDKTFRFFDSKAFEFYYVLENPELGFHPKNCMTRPFGIFPNECKITFEKYFERQSEYRTKTTEITNNYQNIKLFDPEKLYCNDKYCYAIKDAKMLYADDDHHSVDGSILQAKYFMDEFISDKVNDVK